MGLTTPTPDYSRTPRPEWVAALAAVSPPSDNIAWLHLAWEPGEVITIDGTTYDQRVERFVLYQIQPKRFIHPNTLRELEGPHPRSRGQFRPYRSEDGTMRAAWFGGPCAVVTRRQWELYRETGGFALPWWVIQGDQGGHRVNLSPAEQMLFQAMSGHAWDVPRMGALPYADFGPAVLDAIAQYDHLMLRNVQQGADYEQRVMDAQQRAQEAARGRVYDEVFLGTADEHADELRWQIKRDEPAFRPVPWREKDRTDYDAAREQYVTGTLPVDHVDTIKHEVSR